MTQETVKTAVILLFHGSGSESATPAAHRLAEQVKRLGGYDSVETAFLRHVQPDLVEAVGHAVRQGAERIAVVPFFMQAGGHVVKDIPVIIEKARQAWPGVEIIITDHVGSHPMMANIVTDLVGSKIKR